MAGSMVLETHSLPGSDSMSNVLSDSDAPNLGGDLPLDFFLYITCHWRRMRLMWCSGSTHRLMRPEWCV